MWEQDDCPPFGIKRPVRLRDLHHQRAFWLCFGAWCVTWTIMCVKFG